MLGDVRSVGTGPTLVALVVLLAAAIVLAYLHGRAGRLGRGFWSHLAAYASVALVVAVTLLRDGWPQGFWLGGLAVWSADGWQRLSSDPLSSSQILLNTALFVPAGSFWTLLTGRPWRVLATLFGGVLFIECAQAVFRVGAADVADLVANWAGSALGVLGGALILLDLAAPTIAPPLLGAGRRHRRAACRDLRKHRHRGPCRCGATPAVAGGTGGGDFRWDHPG